MQFQCFLTCGKGIILELFYFFLTKLNKKIVNSKNPAVKDEIKR